MVEAFIDYNWIFPFGSYEEAAEYILQRFGNVINFKQFALMELTITNHYSINLQCKYCFRVIRYDIAYFFAFADKDKNMELSEEELKAAFGVLEILEENQVKEFFEKAKKDFGFNGLTLQEFTYAVLR